MTVAPGKMQEIAAAYTTAWNSGSAEAVASFYAWDGSIVINHGETWEGRARIADMAAGFFADVPNLKLVCDLLRCAGNHAVYLWTFTGMHAVTRKPVCIGGWEEWNVDEEYKVRSSHGWYDADEYARQTAAA